MIKRINKKVCLLLTACALSASCVNAVLSPAIYARAEEQKTDSAISNDDSSPDLMALAWHLGANTDYMKIANYGIPETIFEDDKEREAFSDFYNDIFENFFQKADNATKTNYPYSNTIQSLTDGMSWGISVLQTLAHNGLISPSDIQAGAEKMTDIVKNPDVEKILWAYQITQNHTDYKLYKYWKTNSLSKEELLKELITVAEKCMNNGKYFTVSMITKDSSHFVTGIGCADGNWNFNNVTYDKCILTLDSNVVDENNNAAGFSKESCIYINTKTNQCYVPLYDWGSSDKELVIYTIDDDKLLNSKGTINPASEYDTDLSDINFLRTGNPTDSKDPIKIFVTKSDGTEYEQNTLTALGSVESPCLNGFEGEKIRLENCSYAASENQKRWVLAGFSTQERAGSSIELTDYKTILKSVPEDNSEKDFSMQIRLNEGYYDFYPNYGYSFFGKTNSSEISAEVVDDGVILRGNEKIKAYCDVDNAVEGDSSKWDTLDSYKREFIIASNDILVKKDTNQDLIFMIDTDNDGTFETEVEKGDVNSDGVIDASDASEILAGYADASSGNQSFLNQDIADFNGDGVIDASDASDVLAYYADLSSGKIQ